MNTKFLKKDKTSIKIFLILRRSKTNWQVIEIFAVFIIYKISNNLNAIQSLHKYKSIYVYVILQ